MHGLGVSVSGINQALCYLPGLVCFTGADVGELLFIDSAINICSDNCIYCFA